VTASPTRTYGTCVALGAIAALLVGPSRAGKSDLALRFVMSSSEGDVARLVADDQVLLSVENERLIARPPSVLAGKIEVRGLGILSIPYRAEAELRLVIQLCKPEDVPRMPPEHLPTTELVGRSLPVLRLAPFETSAPLKLRLALMQFGG
jgi:HPr kinase/phosphorylase